MFKKNKTITIHRQIEVDYKGQKVYVQWVSFPFRRRTLEGYRNDTIKGMRVMLDSGKKTIFKKETIWQSNFFEENYKIRDEVSKLFPIEEQKEENEYINQVKALFSLWEKDIKEKKETALKEEKERKEKENKEKAKENALNNWNKTIA